MNPFFSPCRRYLQSVEYLCNRKRGYHFLCWKKSHKADLSQVHGASASQALYPNSQWLERHLKGRRGRVWSMCKNDGLMNQWRQKGRAKTSVSELHKFQKITFNRIATASNTMFIHFANILYLPCVPWFCVLHLFSEYTEIDQRKLNVNLFHPHFWNICIRGYRVLCSLSCFGFCGSFEWPVRIWVPSLLVTSLQGIRISPWLHMSLIHKHHPPVLLNVHSVLTLCEHLSPHLRAHQFGILMGAKRP